MSLTPTTTDAATIDDIDETLRRLEEYLKALMCSEEEYLYEIHEKIPMKHAPGSFLAGLMGDDNNEEMKMEWLRRYEKYLAAVRTEIYYVDVEIAKLKFRKAGVSL